LKVCLHRKRKNFNSYHVSNKHYPLLLINFFLDNSYSMPIMMDMVENEKAVPLAVSLPETLITEIDRVAADVKDSRSGVMRRAIREGLPLVRSGGKSDALTLDSELSAEVDQAAKEIELNRSKVLLEAIRTGLHAFWSRKASEKMSLASLKDPKEIEMITAALAESYTLYDDPMMIEHRKILAQKAGVSVRLADLLQHVPEAKHRYELMNQLAKLRNSPGGMGGGLPMGLSIAELEWQIGMSEKYGPQPASWPDEEKRAHNAPQESAAVVVSKWEPKPLSQKPKKPRK
jgi:metal-responsive CopG/Arc/MetJ family transcriptional regulator